ncbi:MAG: polyhydroxyalkanoate depolymerase [Lautropia sp.]
MLYQAYEHQNALLSPLRALAALFDLAVGPADGATVAADCYRAPPWSAAGFGSGLWQRLSAACEVLALATLTHQRPEFGIDEVTVAGRRLPVTEEVALRTPFGALLHFRKHGAAPQPRVLIVAPMSGHFATLLRDTVRTMLADHDVYITDWGNAREAPLAAGRFGLAEYIGHLVAFLDRIGPGGHLMAICQPCVAALAATALMAEDGHPATPASMVLMAGPIDCRIGPTAVNRLATSRSIEWFERQLIARVPARYPGAGRRVYPGFVQLSAFMNMNLERHLAAFRGYFADLAAGREAQAAATRHFYEEYFAVADLPAEFYLETVRLVFQEFALPLGRLRIGGRTVDPRAIRRTALLTVEGERDDICALGQTLAAHDLCGRIPLFMKQHYIQAGVGHYGVFSGRRWAAKIYPIVRELIQVTEQTGLMLPRPHAGSGGATPRLQFGSDAAMSRSGSDAAMSRSQAGSGAAGRRPQRG